MKNGIYLNGWDTLEEMASDFHISYEEIKAIRVLFADYDCGNWEGSCFVLFSSNGKLYEVNGSHCSCFGLEEQWKPEEVNIQELKKRITTSYVHTRHLDILESILRIYELTGGDDDGTSAAIWLMQ